jgi:ATP-dependent DNA helicase RecQ
VGYRAKLDRSPPHPHNQVPRGFSLGSHSNAKEKGASAPAYDATTSAVHPNKRPTPPPPPAYLTPTQQALETRLKDWRREAAKTAGLPSFFIFSDTVLRNITLAAPTSIENLRNVRGVAPEKLDTFGPTVLTLCQA